MNRLQWQDRLVPRDELEGRVREAVAALLGSGVKAGDRVGLLAGNSPLFVVGMMACREIEAVVVPLSPSLPEEVLSDRVRQVDVDLLVAVRDETSRVEKIAPGLSVVAAQEEGAEWATVREREGKGGPAGAVRGARAVLFSSGTTGRPRAWVYTEQALTHHAEVAASHLSQDEKSVVLGVLPLHHAGGFMLLDRVLRLGGELVLEPGFDASRAAVLLEQQGVTHVSLVPVMFQRVLAERAAPPGSVRSVLLGGDRTSPELLQRSCEAGWPVQPSYGLTESCSQAVTATPEEACSMPGTAGRPLAGVRVWIRRESGSEAGVDEEGEIVLEGPTLARAFDGGDAPQALRTGDRGRLDGQGRLFVTGRSLHRIVTGGYTVDALEVEDVLEASGLVEAACVLGVPDGEWGQRVVALVQPSSKALDEGSLVEHARGRLAPQAVPREWRSVSRLPRTLVGKKDRAAALEAFGQKVPAGRE